MADEDDDRVVRLSRMEAFNDGVFRYCYHPAGAGAFSAGRSEGQLLSAVLSLWPSYLAYIVSFATIGATWLEHNSITHYMHGANTAFLRLKSRPAARGLISAFSTNLLAEFLESREDEKVAATIYGITLLAVTSLLSLMWGQAVRRQPCTLLPATRRSLCCPRDSDRVSRSVVLIVVGWFIPLVAVIGYLVVAFFLIFPVHLRRRETSQPGVS